MSILPYLLKIKDIQEKTDRIANSIVGRVKIKSGYFNFIPNHAYNVLQTFRDVTQILPKNIKGSPKFIDVGCGIGNIMALAKLFDWSVRGIECNEELKEYALCEGIDYVDAFDYGPKKGFKEFDIIYYYRPIADCLKMLELEYRIVSTMKKGAILVPFGEAFGTFNEHNVEMKKLSKQIGSFITRTTLLKTVHIYTR